MAKKLEQKHLGIILIITLVAGWFYWFQWRPAQASKECIEKLRTVSQDTELRGEDIDVVFSICMREKGIVR